MNPSLFEVEAKKGKLKEDFNEGKDKYLEASSCTIQTRTHTRTYGQTDTHNKYAHVNTQMLCYLF